MQKVVFWNIFVLVLIGLAFVFYNIGFPFLIGFIIAYFCLPVCKKIESCINSRSIASLLISLLFLVVILLFIWVIIPIVKEDLYNAIKAVSSNFDTNISDKLRKYYKYFPAEYADNLRDEASKYIMEFLSFSMSGILKIFSFNGILMNVISIILVSPFVIFFCLRDWRVIKMSVLSWIPNHQKTNFVHFIKMLDNVMTKYILTQTKNISILAIFYISLLTLIGVKYSLMIGLMSGILSIMPYLGCIFGFILSLIVYIAQIGVVDFHVLLLTFVYIIGYILEVYILAPKLGKELGIHTLWIFFAFLAGIQICGLFGLLISIPVAALINASIKYFLSRFKQSRVYIND